MEKIKRMSSIIDRAGKMSDFVGLLSEPFWNQTKIMLERNALALSDEEFYNLSKVAAGELTLESILPPGLKTFEQRSLARRSMFKRSPNHLMGDFEKKIKNMARLSAMFK